MATIEITNEELAQQVQLLYVAYYGRPADPAGFTHWWNAFAGADDLDNAVNQFGTSAEYEALSAGMSNADLITNLYQQMFNRDPEPAGLQNYLDQLEAGNCTLATLAWDIATGAQNEDATTLANKVAVAEEFTRAVTDLGATYAGEDGIAVGMEVLAAVDDSAGSTTTGITAALAAVEELVEFDMLGAALEDVVEAQKAYDAVTPVNDDAVGALDTALSRLGVTDIPMTEPAMGHITASGEFSGESPSARDITLSRALLDNAGYLMAAQDAYTAAQEAVVATVVGTPPTSLWDFADAFFMAQEAEKVADAARKDAELLLAVNLRQFADTLDLPDASSSSWTVVSGSVSGTVTATSPNIIYYDTNGLVGYRYWDGSNQQELSLITLGVDDDGELVLILDVDSSINEESHPGVGELLMLAKEFAAADVAADVAAGATIAAQLAYLTQDITGLVDTYIAARDSLDAQKERNKDLDEAIADYRQYQEELAASLLLKMNLDEAEDVFEDADLNLVRVDNDDTSGTADDDVFFAMEVSDFDSASVMGFGMQGEDVLYIGPGYTLNTGDIGTDGDNSVLEIFLTMVGLDTVVTLEETLFGSNAAAPEVIEITLVGVAVDDLVFDDDGLLMLA